MKSRQYVSLFSLLALSLAACNAQGVSSSSDASSGADGGAQTDASNAAKAASGPSTPVPTATQRSFQTDALLFVGDGTWASEISSIKNILSSHGATYETVTSAQLDALTLDDIAAFGVMIFPGGAGGTEAGSLTAATHAKLRTAVQIRGVSYVGFCAGSFIAQAPAPASGKDVSYGLGVVVGPVLDYYYLENQGTDIAMTMETFADGTKADILWYGGPVTPNVAGGVIAKYPDGNPAITQMNSGKGFVVLSGPHPTATQAILNAVGVSSSDGIHTDIAWNLINAAIHSQPLTAF